MERAINPRQQRFVQQYLLDLNATGAARRVGYKFPNKQGPRLLVNVGISAAIERAQKERSQRVQISQDMILKVLVEESKRIKNGSAQARIAALKLLGEHLGMFGKAHLHLRIAELTKQLDALK
jgi:phage terminase small subunit